MPTGWKGKSLIWSHFHHINALLTARPDRDCCWCYSQVAAVEREVICWSAELPVADERPCCYKSHVTWICTPGQQSHSVIQRPIAMQPQQHKTQDCTCTAHIQNTLLNYCSVCVLNSAYTALQFNISIEKVLSRENKGQPPCYDHPVKVPAQYGQPMHMVDWVHDQNWALLFTVTASNRGGERGTLSRRGDRRKIPGQTSSQQNIITK